MKTTTRCVTCGGGTGQASPCICVILYSEGDATAKIEIERLTAERDAAIEGAAQPAIRRDD